MIVIRVVASLLIACLSPLLVWVGGADVLCRGPGAFVAIILALWLFGVAVTCPAWNMENRKDQFLP